MAQDDRVAGFQNSEFTLIKLMDFSPEVERFLADARTGESLKRAIFTAVRRKVGPG